MKRLAAAALVVVWMVIPACGQRSSGHGGSSGQSAPAFHGSGGASRGSSGFRGYTPGRSISAPRTYQPGASGAFQRRPSYRPPHSPSYPSPYRGSWRYRRPYVSAYGAGVPYGVSGWMPPYYLGFPDDTGDDESSPSANPAAEGYDEQADEQQPPPWPSAYDQGPIAPAYAQPTPSTESNEAVTLIFKDGRPPVQIHNYLLTRDTLFVGDRRSSQIPVDQLDIPATEKVNRDAGVDFRLPEAAR
jgi:hypothetical protein